MAHDLTDEDEFTAPITVADGVDTHSTMAEVVEAIAQALANRTHHLDVHAAKLDTQRTFTAGQLVSIANAATAILEATAGPGDGGFAGNIWKLQFQFNLPDTTRVRLYTGVGGSALGNWAITTNAGWDPSSAQVWRKDSDAKESNTLRCFEGQLHWYGKPPGSGSWGPNAWDTSQGLIRIGNNVHAGNDIAAGRDLTAGRDMFAAGHVFAGQDSQFIYWPAAPRVMSIPLLLGRGNDVVRDASTGWLSSNTEMAWPVRLPAGAVLEKVEAIVEEKTPSRYTGQTIEYVPDYAAPGVTRTVINAGAATPNTGAGVKLATLSFSNRTIVTSNRYEVTLTPGNANDNVRALRVFFSDPGPRNH